MKYPKIKNLIKAYATSIIQDKPTGLIGHKDDEQIHEAEELGLFDRVVKDTDIFDGYLINQAPHNTCVFYSRAQGASHQNGIHLSARWLAIVAYRNGWLSKDGFSTLDVANKIGYKIGYVPEYECSSDTSKYRGFKNFVTISDEEYLRLTKIAEQFRTPEYRRIRTESLAYKALEQSHTLYVGFKWTSDNNRPAHFSYVLPFTGYVLGGHACELSGNKGDLKMNPQTYGEGFGDKGIVWSKKFSDYGIYIEDMLPSESRNIAFCKQYEGQMVKWDGDPACYVIHDGIKHHVSGEDNMFTFHELFKEVGLKNVKKDLLDAVLEGEQYPFIK